MPKDTLSIAYKLMSARRFDKAIVLLESNQEIYQKNFEYYIHLATAYLYVGDFGAALRYFQEARKISLTDTRLLLGQAVLFLRRGETDRAIQYYIDILEYDPNNKIALNALDFIKTKGDFDTICRWIDTKKIEQFYPPLGINFSKIYSILFPVIAGLLGIFLVIAFIPKKFVPKGTRQDLSALVLTVEDKRQLKETDLASGSYKYILTSEEIEKSYLNALMYFESSRDNACQIEINRILNSNASLKVKQKARLLMEYLEEPFFDNIKDVPTYKQVADDPSLYLDCWVNWSGRVSGVEVTDLYYKCEMLVGYDTLEKVEGIIPLSFSVIPTIQTDKAVKVLAKISIDNGKLCLEGRAVYQSVKENLLN